MKIEQGIMKELGKAKGKGGKGKHVTLDYDSLADVVESSAYKFLTDQEKAQALEEYISVKRQKKGQCPRWNGGENEEKAKAKAEAKARRISRMGKAKAKARRKARRPI